MSRASRQLRSSGSRERYCGLTHALWVDGIDRSPHATEHLFFSALAVPIVDLGSLFSALAKSRRRAPRRRRWPSSRRPDPRGKNGSATGLTTRPGPRLREAVGVPRREAIRVDAGPGESTRESEFSANTARLTACRAAGIVAHGEKGGLNFLYAEKREPVLTSGATFDQLLAQTVYNEMQRLALISCYCWNDVGALPKLGGK